MATFNIVGAVPDCPELQSFNLPQGKLSFRSAGAGDSIVFLHGLLGSSRSWAYQFECFSRKYRVIAWDAPGYGQSGQVSASIDAYVEVLREFIAKLEWAYEHRDELPAIGEANRIRVGQWNIDVMAKQYIEACEG